MGLHGIHLSFARGGPSQLRPDAIGVASGKLRAVSSASIDRESKDRPRIVLAPAWLPCRWSGSGGSGGASKPFHFQADPQVHPPESPSENSELVTQLCCTTQHALAGEQSFRPVAMALD